MEVQMVRMKMLFAIAAAAMFLGLGSSRTFAVTYFSPVTSFEDNDLDAHLDTGTPCEGGTTNCSSQEPGTPGVITGTANNGLIDVGERLVGVLEFTQTFGVPSGGPAAITGEELTGVFDITVAQKIDTGGGEFTFVFAPTAGSTFVDSVAGTMVSLYLDPLSGGTVDLDVINGNCGTLAQCVAAASDGALYLNIGFAGDDEELWVAEDALDSTATVLTIPAGTSAGEFNYLLSILTNNTGLNFGLQDCSTIPGVCTAGDQMILVIGSGQILGGQGLENEWFGRSDTDAQVAPIPEPSALLLLGAGLLGLGSIARRRIKK
jgi:hypothetical protein